MMGLEQNGRVGSGGVPMAGVDRPVMRRRSSTVLALVFSLVFCLWAALVPQPGMAQSGVETTPGIGKPVAGEVPGGVSGAASDAEFWRVLRHGGEGTVSSRDKNAARLIQSAGEDWRNLRNGPLSTYTAWLLMGTMGLLCLFFALRGRIRIEHGYSGLTIHRFEINERVSHWLLAWSFIILGLTGLNLLYGRSLLMPIMGKEAFASLTHFGKLLHNTVAFAFMLAIVLVFFHWIRHNFPNRHDVIWLLKGGGLFNNSHPPSRKFNAGQKILFWLVLICGVYLSATGLILLFPFSTHVFSDVFTTLNGWFGTTLPTQLTLIEEQHFAALSHAVVAAIMMAVVIAHIYIGSIGMEGAINAMTSGDVDLNWAREHHSIWVAEEEARAAAAARSDKPMQPAE